jgi:hypothetical protein
MATRPVYRTEVDGYMSCIDPRCIGYEQTPVKVIRERIELSYAELGGDGSLPASAVERESVYIVQTDKTCEHCGKPVILSDSERPEYPNTSGLDPLALLNPQFQQAKVQDVEKAGLIRDKEMAEMRAAMAEMQAELMRRRGGRPRKEDGDE